LEGSMIRWMWCTLSFTLLCVGTVASAGDQYTLSWSEFSKLNTKSQASYVKALREAVVALEKQQVADSSGTTSKLDSKTPSWLWEQVFAADNDANKICFIAGNISHVNPATGKCSVLKDFACQAGGQPGVLCADLFSQGDKGEKFCKPVDNSLTYNCDQESKKAYGADRDAKTAKYYVQNKKTADFDKLYEAVHSKCSALAAQTDTSVGKRLCLRLQKQTEEIKAQIAKVPSDGPAAPPTPPKAPVGTAVPPIKSSRLPVPFGPVCQNGDPVLTAKQVGAAGKEICNFKVPSAKGSAEGDYYIVRSVLVDGKPQPQLYHSDRANGGWCGVKDVKNGAKLANPKMVKDNKKKCAVDVYQFDTQSIPGLAGGNAVISRHSADTNLCDIKGHDDSKLKVEDFIPGIDVTGERFNKPLSDGHEVGMQYDQRNAAHVLLNELENSNSIFAGHDRVQTEPAAACPDEGSINLNYALLAIMADKNCDVRAPHITNDLGKNTTELPEGDPKAKKADNKEASNNWRVYADVRTDNGANNGQGTIKFTTHTKLTDKTLVSVGWTRAHEGMTVSEWLYGTPAHDNTPAFTGLYREFAESGACTKVPNGPEAVTTPIEPRAAGSH